jgi:hypothetical protein
VKRPYADPDCPKCKGEGWLYARSMITLPGDKGGRDCDCTLDHHRRANMERVWPSLSAAKEAPGLREACPLLGLAKRDLWITSKDNIFRAHLKAVCYRKHHLWDAKVWSDKDLVKAWLNTAYAQGHKIYDTELDDVRVTAMYIDELVESYELVIFLLGVKWAPNKETPSVLLEAVKTRRHLGRPSWIVDQPQAPLTADHRAYSRDLEVLLDQWPHLRLTGKGPLKLVSETVKSARKIPEPGDKNDDEIAEPSDAEAAAQVDEVISDLNDEGGGEEGEDEGGGEEGEDEGGAEEDEEDEDEDDEREEAVTEVRNYLEQMKRNEEAQEEQARRKAFKKRSSKKPRGGKRR